MEGGNDQEDRIWGGCMMSASGNAQPAGTGLGANGNKAVNLEAEYIAHGAGGLRAYEAAKGRLQLVELTPAEYVEACRKAAQFAGV